MFSDFLSLHSCGCVSSLKWFSAWHTGKKKQDELKYCRYFTWVEVVNHTESIDANKKEHSVLNVLSVILLCSFKREADEAYVFVWTPRWLLCKLQPSGWGKAVSLETAKYLSSNCSTSEWPSMLWIIDIPWIVLENIRSRFRASYLNHPVCCPKNKNCPFNHEETSLNFRLMRLNPSSWKHVAC